MSRPIMPVFATKKYNDEQKEFHKQRYRDLVADESAKKARHEAGVEKYEKNAEHYSRKLDIIISETMIAAMKVQDKDQAVADKKIGKIFKDHEQKWFRVCSFARMTDKTISLDPQAFRRKIEAVGEAQSKSEQPPKKKPGRKKKASELTVVKDDEQAKTPE